jgi:hypothetical protein
MRRQSCFLILASAALLTFALTLRAEDEPTPILVGGFETQGSATAGYRFTTIKGYEPKFIELFNLRRGFRMMDFNLMGRAKEGTNPFADSYSINLSGLGGDPYPGGQITLRKNKVYDLRLNYRQSHYYWDRNDDVILPSAPGLSPLRGLTTNHNWATVRRFGSAQLTVHASNNLRFNFEYNRASRDGVNFTTRELEYFGAPESTWGGYLRANPYYVEAPLNELSTRVTGGVSYNIRDWNFHYRLGYQTFEQNLNWNNIQSPQRSINTSEARTANELLNHASWSEFRRLKTPVSEFSYTGRPTRRLDLRGGYIFFRYRGPATMDSAFDGNIRISTNPTTYVPYAVSFDSRAHLSEPNHVFDQGFSLKITDWWNLHGDYRYSRYNVASLVEFSSLRDATTAAEGEEEFEWKMRTNELNVSMEFIPTRSLIVRPGIRYWQRDVQVLEDGVLDSARTRKMKSVWPILSVYFQPSKMFSVRGDVQSNTTSRPYTRISSHTDVGGRFVFRFRPTEKITVEDNLVIRNRKYDETDFRNSVRSNGLTVAYALHERFSVFGGFSYDSLFAKASLTWIRGTAPLTGTVRDQMVNRLWQAGLAVQPTRNFGINFTGHFVRTTGLGTMVGEAPYSGPMTWPMATGSIYYDFPKAGRLSVDLQRTYYLEEIIRGNDFRGNLLMIRWTKDF